MEAAFLGSPETHIFQPDGGIPNSRLPVIITRSSINYGGKRSFSEVLTELTAHVERHNWELRWADIPGDVLHYHPDTHEVLVCVFGRGQIRFGGTRYTHQFHADPGCVFAIPVGVGHMMVEWTRDLVMAGIYPMGTVGIETCFGHLCELEEARPKIERVQPPATDPIWGAAGPVAILWKH